MASRSHKKRRDRKKPQEISAASSRFLTMPDRNRTMSDAEAHKHLQRLIPFLQRNAFADIAIVALRRPTPEENVKGDLLFVDVSGCRDGVIAGGLFKGGLDWTIANHLKAADQQAQAAREARAQQQAVYEDKEKEEP